MTRLWPNGEHIHVTLDERAIPQAFVWRERRHVVQDLADRWQVDVDWWRGRVRRDYFKLTTRGGLLVIIYHQYHPSTDDSWYLQRLYD